MSRLPSLVPTTRKEILLKELADYRNGSLNGHDHTDPSKVLAEALSAGDVIYEFYSEYRDQMKRNLPEDRWRRLHNKMIEYSEKGADAKEKLDEARPALHHMRQKSTQRFRWPFRKSKKMLWVTPINEVEAFWKLTVELVMEVISASRDARDHTAVHDEALNRLINDVDIVHPSSLRSSNGRPALEPGFYVQADHNVDPVAGNTSADAARQADRTYLIGRAVDRIERGEGAATSPPPANLSVRINPDDLVGSPVMSPGSTHSNSLDSATSRYSRSSTYSDLPVPKPSYSPTADVFAIRS